MSEPMNDTERAQWIDNDEGLYDWWRSSRQPKRAFIRENRRRLDRIIQGIAIMDRIIQDTIDGKIPAHHLKYHERIRQP